MVLFTIRICAGSQASPRNAARWRAVACCSAGKPSGGRYPASLAASLRKRRATSRRHKSCGNASTSGRPATNARGFGAACGASTSAALRPQRESCMRASRPSALGGRGGLRGAACCSAWNATNVPAPTRRSMRPSDCSAARASSTVLRDTCQSRARSRAEGRRAPCARRPSTIASRQLRRISALNDRPLTAGPLSSGRKVLGLRAGIACNRGGSQVAQ